MPGPSGGISELVVSEKLSSVGGIYQDISGSEAAQSPAPPKSMVFTSGHLAVWGCTARTGAQHRHGISLSQTESFCPSDADLAPCPWHPMKISKDYHPSPVPVPTPSLTRVSRTERLGKISAWSQAMPALPPSLLQERTWSSASLQPCHPHHPNIKPQ